MKAIEETRRIELLKEIMQDREIMIAGNMKPITGKQMRIIEDAMKEVYEGTGLTLLITNFYVNHNDE